MHSVKVTFKNSTMMRKQAQNIYKAIVDNNLYNASFGSIETTKKCNDYVRDIAQEMIQNEECLKHLSLIERQEMQDAISILSNLDFYQDYMHSVSMLKLYAKILADHLFDIAKWGE